MAGISLARHLERLRTEPGLKKNVVAIAVLLTLGLVASGWILGNQRFNAPWSDKFTLTAEFEAVPGVAPGNGQEVRVAGVMVGQIARAEVGPTGKAQLVMELEPDVELYRDARLVLRPKSPLNEMYVEISPGAPPAERLRSGTTLPVTSTERPIMVDEVLASLDADARSALTALLRESDVALAKAPKDLAPGLTRLSSVSEDLRPVAIELEKRRAHLARLVTAASHIATAIGEDDARLTSLAGNLDTTLASTARGREDLRATLAELPGLSTQLNRATREVTRLSAQLDPTLADIGAAADVLPKALRKLTSTARSLDRLLDAAKPTLKVARPVLADLRPVARDLRVALPRLEHTTARLDPVTAQLLGYLPDLGAFMINTRSITSLRDANGGILRGMLEITPDTLPNGTLLPSALQELAR